MEGSPEQGLRAWVEYLRDMGMYDLYHSESTAMVLPEGLLERLRASAIVPAPTASSTFAPTASSTFATKPVASAAGPIKATPAAAAGRSGSPSSAAREGRSATIVAPATLIPVLPAAAVPAPEPARAYFHVESEAPPPLPPELAAPMPKPQPLESLAPPPDQPISGAQRMAALAQLRAEIGDCTRCPLAYAGRHTIVFGEGDPNARLMFIGEGPGADEDASGLPFVGKAGQLLNNMIGAMGLQREQVFIANIVKCRPPGNRAPEFVEATTCSQFLLRQIDIVRPEVIVALGATAATYVLGVRQSLASLRGQWFRTRDAKVVVTFHPAFLLRDPRQKGEAWKDLQRVMAELALTPPAPRKS